MNEEALKELIQQSHRNRCLVFGCVYGIPHVDKEPKDECIYCGEPVPDRSDFWGEGVMSKLESKV